MAKTKDKVVAEIYETYDYDKFKVVVQNRGHMETHGVKRGKLSKLQNLINHDRYVPEKGIVFVNDDYLIVEGRHTFEVRKQNKMPIRYTFLSDERFNNGATRRQLVGHIYNINTINTAWTGHDFFYSAVQTKAPLALMVEKICEKHDNKFKWSDVMGLLLKDESLFNGRFSHLELSIFDDKELIEEITSHKFKLEMQYFVVLNAKARIANRKGPVLQAAYQIIHKAGNIMDISKFRRAILKIDDTVLQSNKMLNMRTAITTMVKHFDRIAGQSIEPKAVMQEIGSKQHSVMAKTSTFDVDSPLYAGFKGKKPVKVELDWPEDYKQ